ncbi:late secretory pathway protein AVL9 homolog isoform X2 [Zophobas morio]|uniref:late secretory pathway protein AVL9 homolog isoform X2 n=1 Tax=Zophobas morio TaxID=2755281 RepID=UPI0030827085
MEMKEGPILYVVVVGFHHKKGCQVEFSFPPLVPGSPNECPPGWKYLPTLALPDGSHNYDDDTVFFHLPSLTNPRQTVFGISCFRQIPIEKIKNRTSDMTRGTIQKSVCVLSKIPLYGQIQVKMSLITHAYFDEGDFSKVSILEDTYHHLNSVLTQNDFHQQIFVGLSARDFVLQWRHKAVLLFKLLLLERRLIFYKSPVHPLCSTILTLTSLFPEMIEKGMGQSACIRLSRPMSPMPEFSDSDNSQSSSPVKTQIENIDNTNQNIISDEVKTKEMKILEHRENEDKKEVKGITEVGIEITESAQDNEENLNGKNNSLQRELSSDTIADSVHNNMAYLAHLSTSSCGFPLTIFTKGFMCLPYLSLPYLDLLTDINVRGYVVGATNILFKQKSQLYDVLVDIDAGRIECQDVELRKQLHLTTEDLRFADYVVKHVSEERHDVFLDGVGWEGGDEWIRTQFRIYLLCLMRTSLLQDGSKEIEHFNTNFVSSWRETHNYKIWLSGINPGILDVNPGHPFAGQLSVADMKLRLAHSDSGRKFNQAMVSTGRAVATTSKAVGGAISQAKGVFSNWWSNLLVSPEPVQKALEAFPDNTMQIEDSTIDQNIPKSINKNLSNGNIDKSSFSEGGSECSLPNNIHQPGEVHTV